MSEADQVGEITRHPMPSGHTVDIRDPHCLRRGDKKRMLAAVTDTDRALVAGYEILDALLVALIVGWSYDLPLPAQSPASLDELPIGDDEALSELVEPARKMLFPDKPSPDQHADPLSPSVPSSA